MGCECCVLVKALLFACRPQSSCEQDIAELQSQKYMTCDEISQEIVTRETINVTAVNAYCRLRCSDYLVDLYHRVVADCGVVSCQPGVLCVEFGVCFRRIQVLIMSRR